MLFEGCTILVWVLGWWGGGGSLVTRVWAWHTLNRVSSLQARSIFFLHLSPIEWVLGIKQLGHEADQSHLVLSGMHVLCSRLS
jgi:hypothetical protein